ncbi:DUF3142 domain-containing protein [Buttiauxella selenatireducens]|uniref:DUF3142 domain-containing protein n=1 Tax=Buttiauxella selenatireducens TaxID=3073902 RepID=A0ABY9SEZ3_9ENTR|nr:DUF3142 domain-containing protein [Buttiauxella sp. R73]WMY76066.1 DUF3142 domain-containing protein [Buttiauxella sp. R73]
MGTRTALLLVATLLISIPAGAVVQAEEYQEFWLWSGVKPTPAMRNAQVVYLHQGEIVSRHGQAVFERMGLPVSRLTFPQIWLTVRITTLDVPETLWPRIMQLLQLWAKKGNIVIGLQIDFDASTYRLDEYGQFLGHLRTLLPAEYALGVTGLLDWAKTGSIATLNTLPIDELIVQSYQGRKTVPNYSAYLPSLSRLAIPWKIGVVQNGEWDNQQESRLWTSPWFRGAVVFMLNPRR